MVFEGAEELYEFLRLFGVIYPDGGIGYVGDFRLLNGNAQLFEFLLNLIEVFGGGIDYMNLLAGLNVFRTRFDSLFENSFLVYTFGGHLYNTFAVEEKGDAPAGSQLSAVFVKDIPNLGYGAVLVVGLGYNHNSHTAGSVSLVNDLFDSLTLD